MSAAIPTSSSSQAAPPASPPPEIHRDPDPDPTPTAIAPSEVVAETKPDESTTSLPPAPQSPAQPPGLGDQPARVESQVPDPAPALRSVPARPHAALTESRIEGERPLPAVPANVTLSPRMETSLRPRVVSDPGKGHAHRPVRLSEPPPVQRLALPGSGIFRQQPASHPSEFGSQDVWPLARVTSPSQVRPLALPLLRRVVTT